MCLSDSKYTGVLEKTVWNLAPNSAMAVRKRKTARDFPHAHSHMHVSRRASCLGASRGQNDDDDDADGGDGGGDDDNDMRSRLAAGHARPSVGLADRFPF